MKKIISLILVLALAVCFAGCSDSPGSTEPSQGAVQPSEGTAPASTDPVQTTPVETNSYMFTYKSTDIAMKADAAPILAALGEPISYTEETSCAFEGLDKTYYFGSFYITTYPDGDTDRIFSLWFADDSITTAEGIYIGASEAQVTAAYGSGGYNGSNAYIMNSPDCKLTVIIQDGVVSSILYDAVF